MEVMNRKSGWARSGERGFTLPEVLVTIAIMGILAVIAIPSWQTVTQGRQVDSAANQLASDLRLARTRAANRLVDYSVVLSANSQTYMIGPVVRPPGVPLDSRTLPDGTQTGNPTAVTIVFSSDGASALSPSGISITVRSSNDATRTRTIDLNLQTSRVSLVP